MDWKIPAGAACVLLAAIAIFFLVASGNGNAPETVDDTMAASPSATPSPVNETLTIPPNEAVIGGIDWSAYPNLIDPRVSNVYLADPNDVIDHDFIEVQMCVSVVDTDNKTIVFRQLAGVAREARRIYGNNSDINVFGCHGNAAWLHVAMLPYSEKVWGMG